MEILSAGDLVAQIRKRFGIRGDPSLALSGDVIPVASLGDISLPPFHSKGGFSTGGTSPAVAANTSMLGVFADPAVVPGQYRGVVNRVAIAIEAAGSVLVQLGVIPSAALGGFTTNRPVNSWDSVVVGPALERARPMITLVAKSDAPGTPVLDFPFTVRPPGNTGVSLVVEGPWVVAPGNIFVVCCLTVNTGLTCGFIGDEFLLG